MMLKQKKRSSYISSPLPAFVVTERDMGVFLISSDRHMGGTDVDASVPVPPTMNASADAVYHFFGDIKSILGAGQRPARSDAVFLDASSQARRRGLRH